MTILVVGDVVDDISVQPLAEVTPASDTPATIRMAPGGSAANVAAWLGSLGVPTRFVGRVGADAVERHAAALQAHGVDARLAADPELPTATSNGCAAASRTNGASVARTNLRARSTERFDVTPPSKNRWVMRIAPSLKLRLTCTSPRCPINSSVLPPPMSHRINGVS